MRTFDQWTALICCFSVFDVAATWTTVSAHVWFILGILFCCMCLCLQCVDAPWTCKQWVTLCAHANVLVATHSYVQYVCTCVRTYVRMYTCIHTYHTCACMPMHTHMYMCTYIRVYLSLCVYVGWTGNSYHETDQPPECVGPVWRLWEQLVPVSCVGAEECVCVCVCAVCGLYHWYCGSALFTDI